MRSLLGSSLAMAILLAIDLGSKAWVREAIPLFRSTELIPYFIDLTHVRNPGVSFSFLGNLPDGFRIPLLAGISLVATVLLGVYWFRQRAHMNALTEWAFLLILPGAAGNLFDRVWFGMVTDFFHFRIGTYSLFVNNIADIYISIGVVCYIAGMLVARKQEQEHARGKQ